MKPTKLLSLGLALIFITSICRAQDVINLIPKDASFVSLLDINQINTKARFAELAELPLLKKMSEEITKNLFRGDSVKDDSNRLDLTKYGINISGKFYFYFGIKDKMNYGALILPLNDEAKFADFVKLLTGNNEQSPITTENNYKYALKGSLRITWNNKSASVWNASMTSAYRDSLEVIIKTKYPDNSAENMIADTLAAIADPSISEEPQSGTRVSVIEETANAENSTAEVSENTNTGSTAETSVESDTITTYDNNNNYESSYENSPYFKIQSELDRTCDSVVSLWCASTMQKLLEDKGANSLAANKEFADHLKTNPDAAMLLDFGLYGKLLMQSMTRFKLMSLQEMVPFASLSTLCNDQMMFSKLSLNKDDIELVSDMKYSKQTSEIYKEIKKKKISASFLKYMNKNTMGYIAFGADIPGLSKGIGNYLRNSLFPLMGEYGNIAAPALEVLDLIVDEQTLYKLFTGDAVFAVNGVKPVEVIHTSYNYDDNYNKTEVTDTSLQNQPEVVLMVGIQNQIDVNKIINLLVSTKILKQEGSLYSIAKNDSPVPVYFTMKDNILFVSNIKSYIQNPVVYDQNQQIGSEHAKLFAKNTSVVFINTSDIAGYFAKKSPEKNQKMITDAAALFSNVTMYSKNTGKGYSTTYAKLKLAETSDNSLADIIKFINSIYVASTSTSSDQKADE